MNFIVYTNDKKDKDLEVTKKIFGYIAQHGGNLFINDKFKPYFNGDLSGVLRFVSGFEEISADYALVIGGDGTILRASKEICKKNVPIIGVNLGKVGYMAELETEELSLIEKLFDDSDEICVDSRMMLDYSVIRNGKCVHGGIALNEAVVSKGDISRMIDVDLMTEDGVIAEYQCDGIIASTPTGSTAYSMSAGGAIIDPKLECISVIPSCAYLCINSSPIIFSKNSHIKIRFCSVRGSRAYLSADGSECFELCDGDIVEIGASDYTTKLIRLKKNDFYKLLNTKLTNRMLELAKRI